MVLVLPDLVQDGQHAAAVDMLSELLRNDSQFTAPVLDSLGSLQLSPEMLKQVSEMVTDSVASANVADLPVVIRFLLACIALNMKVTLYPLAKFWGYRRFEPQPDTVLVTCAAMCKPTTLSLRPAGSPEAALSARQCPGLRGASASLGRSAG